MSYIIFTLKILGMQTSLEKARRGELGKTVIRTEVADAHRSISGRGCQGLAKARFFALYCFCHYRRLDKTMCETARGLHLPHRTPGCAGAGGSLAGLQKKGGLQVRWQNGAAKSQRLGLKSCAEETRSWGNGTRFAQKISLLAYSSSRSSL